MAASNLTDYVQKVALALDEREGVKCAELLSFSHSHIANARLRVEAPEAVCSRYMGQPFDEMVAAHIKLGFERPFYFFYEVASKTEYRPFGRVLSKITMTLGNTRIYVFRPLSKALVR